MLLIMKYLDKTIISILFSLLFAGLTPMLFGQTHHEQVTIIGSFEPSLRTVQKIRLEPELPGSMLQELNSEINRLNIVIPSKSTIGSINPLSVQAKEKDFDQSNYLKVGIGSLASPVFMFSHYSKLTRQTRFHAGIEHLSSWVKMKDYGPSDWMKNRFKSGIMHDFSNHSIAGEVFYKRNHHRYYGFRPDDFPGLTIGKDTIAQYYQHFGVKANLQSTYRDPMALHHTANIEYSRFSDKYQNFENGIHAKISGNKNFELFRFGGIQTLALDIQTSAFNIGDSVSNQNDIFLGLLPKLELSGSFYQLGAAIRFEYLNDSSGAAYLYPKIWGKLMLLDQKLAFYASMDGGHQRQSISNIIETNPFITPGTNSWWENSKFRFETGVKTSLIKHLDVRFGLQYDELENKGFYITDTTTVLQNQLIPVFDNGQRLQFKTELSYKLSDRWRATATMINQSFKLDSLLKAWHEPDLTVTLDVGHQWNENWYFSSGLHIEGKRFAPTYNNGIETVQTLKPIIDINLHASYKVNEQLAFYASLNNLLHQKYERYYQYPVQGIQLFAGITVGF